MSATSRPSQSNGSHNAGLPSFALSLPENCVEYMLFVIEADTEPKKILSSLEAVRKASVRLCNQLTKDYIWQRDGFNLEIKSEQGMFRVESPKSSRAALTYTVRPAVPSWSDRPWRLDRRRMVNRLFDPRAHKAVSHAVGSYFRQRWRIHSDRGSQSLAQMAQPRK